MSTGIPSPPSTPPTEPPRPPGGIAGRERAPAAPARAPGRLQRWAPSPGIGPKELLAVAAAGVALAVITTWPLVLHMGSTIAPDLGDPVRTAWEVAWVGHAMLHDPLHLFNANTFYPHPLSLAFSDSLLGYGPAAFFGSGTVAALVRYNLLFLFAWALCFVGAYLLARELGLGRLGAAATGAAFAYAPYRVTEAGHLHVISSGGLPLALFLLLRGYRRERRGLVLAGWLVSAWQVSLGFTLGLQYCYLLAVLALIALVAWWRGALRPGPAWEPGPAVHRPPGGDAELPTGPHVRPRAPASGGTAGTARQRTAGAPAVARGPFVPRRLLAVTLIGIAALGVVTVYQAKPYLQVAAKYPTAKRTVKEVKNYSSGPAALLAASTENRVWAAPTAAARARVHSKNEDVFFPGGLILVLAVLGLAGVGGAVYTKRLRLGLGIGVLTVSILALGLGLTGAGYPYRLLFDYAPGWNGVRVPGRVFTLATLFYALLAGAGAQQVVGVLRRRGARTAVPVLAGALLCVAIVGEGAGHLGHPVVPQPARAEAGLRGPVLDLPTDGAYDRVWEYFSTNGFYKTPLGNSTFDLPALDDLRGGMYGFPDRASIEKLRFYGIHTVVLHTQPLRGLPAQQGWVFPEPPNPAAAAAKPVAGLGVTTRRVGSLVIYEIGPGPAALHGTD